MTAMPGAAPPAPALQPVAAWGRLGAPLHQLLRLQDRHMDSLPRPTPGMRGLAFGNGRSYGDVALNPGGLLWDTRGLDRFIAFDSGSGVIECEAGVLLDELIALALPRGWFLPVTPGTRFVTLGGAIANDVHGKNHHRAGTLGEHVLALQLLRSDGSRLECSPTQQADWLRATIGGLGLTGLILRVRLQLMRVPGPWLETDTRAFGRLDEFFAHSREAESGWDYGVAWLDCVRDTGDDNRGLFFCGRHVAHPAPAPAPRRRSLPFTPPVSLVNGLTLRAFNQAYFHRHRLAQGRRLQPLLPFFYPLDGLLHWNRMYGPRGFHQYQCVVPRAVEREATAALLRAIRRSGQGSFLAVLKTFADRPAAGLLSFPMAGTTLALDFPERGAATQTLFTRLDAIVAEAGGRLYPAKDARMPAALFRQGWPTLARFAAYRDPAFSSAMSRRLLGD